MDDLNFEWKLISGVGYVGEINSWKDYYESVSNFDGRFVTNGLAQAICGLFKCKLIYNILAACIFGFWMWIITKISLPNLKNDKIWLSAIFLTFLFWIYNSEPTAFYCCVVFGFSYLYPSLLCLLVIYLFEKDSLSRFQQAILIGIAFFAGYSIETFAVGTTAYVGISILLYFRKLKKYHFISAGLLLLGVILKMCDPGNFSKLNEVNQHNYLSVFARWTMHGEIFIFICILILLFRFKRNCFTQFIKNNLPLVTAWVISILFISLIGQQVYGRMMLGIELWGFILFIRLLAALSVDNWLLKAVPIGSCAFIVFLSGIVYWQSIAASPMEEVDKQGRTSALPYVCVSYISPDIPRIFEKYVNPLAPSFVDKLELRYRKPVYFYEQSLLDIAADPNTSINSNNPFHRKGDILCSLDQIPDTCCLTLTLGEPLTDLKSRFKQIYKKDFDNSKQDTKLFVTQKIGINPDQTLSVIYLSEKDFLRKINDIQLINPIQ